MTASWDIVPRSLGTDVSEVRTAPPHQGDSVDRTCVLSPESLYTAHNILLSLTELGNS
jgi:hypothetical protein